MSRFLKMKFVIPCVLAVAASPLTAVAMQDGSAEPATRVVNFADLDLSRNTGVATLYSRIRSAARDVCQSEEVWSLRMQNFDCRHDAIAKAIANVKSPELTNYYIARGGVVTANAQQ